MAANSGDLSTLQWALGLVASLGVAAVGLLAGAMHKHHDDMGEALEKVKKEHAEEVAAIWGRLNSATDAAAHFVTRDELQDFRRHLDERLDRLTTLVVEKRS